MTQTNLPAPEEWLSLYGDRLYRYALSRVRLEDVAEDLVQETLLAAFQGAASFNQQAAIGTWLIGILKNKIVDYFRKVKRELPLLDEADLGDDLIAHQFDEHGHWQVDLVDWGTPEKSLNNQEFWKVFYHCQSRLPETMARLFILRLEGVSTEECCQLLGFTTSNQLWVTLSRTRMKLRQCLELLWFEQGDV